MRLKIFAVKFSDRGRCRTSKISNTELLMIMFRVLKLLTNLTKSSNLDSTVVLDKPLPVQMVENRCLYKWLHLLDRLNTTINAKNKPKPHRR